MRTPFPFVIGLFLCWCTGSLRGQSSPALIICDSFPQLESELSAYGSSTVIVNFWATWCAPCVKELPYFEQLQREYSSKGVKVFLVSLDFRGTISGRLMPFIQEKNLQSTVVVLADQDGDSWIPKVNNTWDGAIPVTLVMHGGKSAFHREDFTNFKDLLEFVQPFLPTGAEGSVSRR